MIQHVDLSKPVYEKLKEMILTQELKPGEKIVQEKIAESLGVSRTPLLKALQVLENEYLVESIPRRGMYVRKLDLKEMIDVYDCREAIEGMAARILAERCEPSVVTQLEACFEPFKKAAGWLDYAASDERFHRLLVQLTGNTAMDKIYFFGNIHGRVVSQGLLRGPEETLPEHFAMIKAIADGDPEEAERLTREHIRNSRKLLTNQYQNQLKKDNIDE
ncbi:MAG: GntR family transcriptional regulator [Bacteroidota bacterium]